MTTRNWRPSESIQFTVMGELLSLHGRARFKDLWAACKNKLSKASFVKALTGLEARGFIIRNRTGRKYVEFELNRGERPFGRFLERQERRLFYSENLATQLSRGIAGRASRLTRLSKSSTRRQNMLKALVYGQASSLALAVVTLAFGEAEDLTTPGESSYGRLIEEMIHRSREAHRQGIVSLFNADREGTHKALEDWTKDLVARSQDLASKVSWRQE